MMKRELTSEVMLTEPEDSKTGNGKVEFAIADSASEVGALFDKSTSCSESVLSDLFPELAVLQSPTLTSSSQTPIGPKSQIGSKIAKVRMGPKSRVGTKHQMGPKSRIGPKSRVGSKNQMGPKSRIGAKNQLDTVEDMEVDEDVSIF